MKPLLTTGLLLAAAWAIVSGASAQQAILRPAESFGAIQDQKARSVALFEEAGKVITHPRCVNCHPVSDRPLQGKDGHPHQPAVFAGDSGMGAGSVTCTGCHGPSNFTLVGTRTGSMPGHPQWHLAPREMAWQGKALGDICRQIKDPARNGGKTLVALHEHMATDGLVGWGWDPGKGRDPVPGTQALFGDLIKAWIDTGAECPA